MKYPLPAVLGSMSALALAAALPALPAAAAAKAKPVVAKPVIPTQLPRNAKPSHYTIEVTPDAANLSFTGHVVIDFDLLAASRTIALNAADLDFASASIKGANGKAITLKVAVNAEAQTATFTAPAALPKGKYALDLNYSGKIYQQATGLFALDYKDPKGAQKRALFTQFEAPDARRFIPSWDEPIYKATFDLTANVPSDEMAVSNMPIVSNGKIGGGKSKVTFQKSPLMSTYLLFFGVGEFDRITKMAGPTEVGVIVGKGNGEKGRYALDASAELVQFYNEYFDTPYPLPKLDNVAGPGQSQFFSAMENWGAIFTFERVLLVDPKITSARGMQGIYSTDAHEIAHQWFGDLVTMQWWDDLWLNEGFASWMETKASSHFKPEWQPELDRIEGRERAMGLDAVKTTHPVIQKITTVEQTSQAFDAIAYQKGEAVITMLENYAGENVWRDGLRAYMKKHAYANTNTDDLWGAVEAAGAKGLVSIAHDFTKKPGIPLIKVASVKCSGGNTLVSFNQGEFSRDRKAQTDAKPLLWNVPVVAQTVGGEAVRTIIRNGKGILTVPGCGTLLVNAGQGGYYRVQYSPEMMAALTRDFAKLSPIDQLGLLADAQQMGYGGYQQVSVALDLLNAVPANASPRVLESAALSYQTLYDGLKGDAGHQAKVAATASKRFGPVLARLGMSQKANEPLLDSNLRSTLITALGHMGDKAVLAEANRLFALLDSDKAALDGPLRSTWFGIIAYNADAATWDKLHKSGQDAENQVLRTSMYTLLGRTKDMALADKALKMALTSEPGPTVSPGMITAVAEEHPDEAVDFALANLPAVNDIVDISSRSRYIASLGKGSSDPAMIAKLDNYAKANLTVESRKPVDGAISAIRTKLDSAARIKGESQSWVDAQP